MHAFFFSGTITLIAASCILYSQYGFWNDRYIATSENDLVATDIKTKSPEIESPTTMMGAFLQEARNRLNSLPVIQASSTDASTVGKSSFLEGKEVFDRDADK